MEVARVRRGYARGERHGRAKLTNAEAAEIRLMYEIWGFRQIDIAREYKISQRVISLIIRGESWKS